MSHQAARRRPGTSATVERDNDRVKPRRAVGLRRIERNLDLEEIRTEI